MLRSRAHIPDGNADTADSLPPPRPQRWKNNAHSLPGRLVQDRSAGSKRGSSSPRYKSGRQSERRVRAAPATRFCLLAPWLDFQPTRLNTEKVVIFGHESKSSSRRSTSLLVHHRGHGGAPRQSQNITTKDTEEHEGNVGTTLAFIINFLASAATIFKQKAGNIFCRSIF